MAKKSTSPAARRRAAQNRALREENAALKAQVENLSQRPIEVKVETPPQVAASTPIEPEPLPETPAPEKETAKMSEEKVEVKQEAPKTNWGLVIGLGVIGLVLAALAFFAGRSQQTAAPASQEANAETVARQALPVCDPGYPGTDCSTPTAPVSSSATPLTIVQTQVSVVTATPRSATVANAEATPTSLEGSMDEYVHVWEYTPETAEKTPRLRDDEFGSGTTGLGETHSYKIGVSVSQFAVVKGLRIEYRGHVFGGDNGCALIALAPGYHRGVTITEGRWEVYFLPDSDPRDPDGWAKVLVRQAIDLEHDTEGCPNSEQKTLDQVTVFYSNEEAPLTPEP